MIKRVNGGGIDLLLLSNLIHILSYCASNEQE